MITKFTMAQANAESEFGMACQRLVPWAGQGEEPPFGAMACYLPANGRSAPDCHDQDEVMIMLTGTGTVDIGGERCTAGPGDVIIIPRNKEHVVLNEAAQTLSWVSCYWPLHEQPGGGQA
ncbi:cupin domain-containing protein [Kitasatospora sp. NBC_01287]|uniref:cupin domain-containing protein n=1 Tax=Kitasatospora sp. NBC_01287 TaxID=2903573 RepID=UPI002254E6A0|nr:cupin domain-containing protein [Kitasatospora sp. NBC_01287]MCX4746938.1 cupin domain-containing protein [Kitasatospora sp. NBC_01287]